MFWEAFATKAQVLAAVNVLNAARRDLAEGKTIDDAIKRHRLSNSPASFWSTLSRWLWVPALQISKSKSGYYLHVKEPRNMAFHVDEESVFLTKSRVRLQITAISKEAISQSFLSLWELRACQSIPVVVRGLSLNH